MSFSGKSRLWFSAVKKIGGELFFSKEPHWHYGLFCVFHAYITCHHIIRTKLSIIHTNPYYSLPLFEFFNIPDPATAVGLLNNFLESTFLAQSVISLSPDGFFNALKIILIFCLLFSMSGLFFQRFFTACSLIFFFLFQGWLYGFVRSADDPYVYHSANIIWFILLIQLTAPSNPLWTAGFWIKRLRRNAVHPPPSPRYYPVYPRLLVILTIGITFFGSFWCKLNTSGFQWINGHTLQAYLLEASVERPLSHGYFLASQNFYLIWLLNISVWVFQSTAWVGFLFPKTRLFYGAMALSFHIGIFLFLGINFTPFYFYYVILIPELYQFFRKMRARRV